MTPTTQECRIGDALHLTQGLPADSIDLIITSPPYWGLRDYGVDGQIGLEPTLEAHHKRLLVITAELHRALKPSGVMFWNHGDSYNGDKCLAMQNERLIMRMIDDQGWILRNRLIWNKPNGMPSSVRDRFSNKYEPIYLLAKSHKYWFDLDAVRIPAKYAEVWGRKGAKPGTPYKQNNPRSRWGWTRKEVQRAKTADESYKASGMRNPPQPSEPGAFNIAGKNPGDVCTMDKEDWLHHCKQLWDLFANGPGDLLRIPTQPYPESHFATFPEALIEPLIQAACPHEVCPVCGFARTRITDAEFVPQQDVSPDMGASRGTTERHTLGWTSCDCGAGWIAGVVLDPFCGSGTVLGVCRRMDMNAIGFELNPEYEPLIRERSMAHTPPLSKYGGTEGGRL